MDKVNYDINSIHGGLREVVVEFSNYLKTAGYEVVETRILGCLECMLIFRNPQYAPLEVYFASFSAVGYFNEQTKIANDYYRVVITHGMQNDNFRLAYQRDSVACVLAGLKVFFPETMIVEV